MLTWFPSTTAFALALGAGSPCADQLYAGTLGFSAAVILTLLSLLMSAFSLPIPPGRLTTSLHRLTERSATNQRTDDSGQMTDPAGGRHRIRRQFGEAGSMEPLNRLLTSDF